MFLKNSGRIFKSDLKKLARNWVAIVIACGVALLPSLYAWINILASWDPYGNTGGVKVGIVNNDEGASIEDISINIGAELVDQLKENKKLGWTFFDSDDEGIEQCRLGKVYATIIIPEDFSGKMATLLDETPVKPQLDYYVNEKINAIAPKMTDSGASTLQKQITESFIQTVVQKVFEVLNPLGYDIDKNYDKIEKFQSLLNLVDDKLPQVSERLNNLLDKAKDGRIDISGHDDDVKYLKEVLNNAISYTNDVKADTAELKSKSAHTTAEMRSNLAGMSDALSSMENSLDSLSGTISTKKPNITSDLSSLNSSIESLNDRINKLDFDIFDDSTRAEMSGKVEQLKATLSTLSDFLGTLDDASHMMSDASDRLAKLQNIVGRLSSQIAELSKTVDDAFSDAERALEKLQDLAESIERINDSTISQAAANIDKTSPLWQQIEKTLREIKDKADNGEDTSIARIKLSTQIGNLLNKVESNHNRISGKLDDIYYELDDMQVSIKELRNFLLSADINTSALINNLHKQINSSAATLTDINNILKRSDDDTIIDFSDELNTISDKLSSLSKKISSLEESFNNTEDFEKALDATKSLCTSTKTLVNTISNAMSSSLDTKIQSFLDKANSASSDLQDLFTRSISGIDEAQEFLDKLNNNDFISVEDVEKFQNAFPEYLSDMTDVAKKIKSLSGVINLKDAANMLQNDGTAASDFFASPVELNTNKLFTVKNYGAGLTPFYTTLCLWVGTLLMGALLTTKALNADFAFTPNEEFMGKFMLFGTMALLQGFIAAMGDVFVLKVEILHPVLFVLLGMLYSLVFTSIVYTLISLFDNVGKAIGVVFLVFQIAAAGGTFPIQVTPEFFQKINKFLPFTYAINGMREAVAGVVFENLMLDIAVLLVYGAVFIALGLVLKRYANKALKKFIKQLSESGVIGH